MNVCSIAHPALLEFWSLSQLQTAYALSVALLLAFHQCWVKAGLSVDVSLCKQSHHLLTQLTPRHSSYIPLLPFDQTVPLCRILWW